MIGSRRHRRPARLS